MNIPTLVEIKTDDFSAVLIKFNEIAAAKVFPIMMEQSPAKQSQMALDLFMSELSDDKREQALQLNTKQIQEFMTKWMHEADDEK